MTITTGCNWSITDFMCSSERGNRNRSRSGPVTGFYNSLSIIKAKARRDAPEVEKSQSQDVGKAFTRSTLIGWLTQQKSGTGVRLEEQVFGSAVPRLLFCVDVSICVLCKSILVDYAMCGRAPKGLRQAEDMGRIEHRGWAAEQRWSP